MKLIKIDTIIGDLPPVRCSTLNFWGFTCYHSHQVIFQLAISWSSESCLHLSLCLFISALTVAIGSGSQFCFSELYTPCSHYSNQKNIYSSWLSAGAKKNPEDKIAEWILSALKSRGQIKWSDPDFKSWLFSSSCLTKGCWVFRKWMPPRV